MGYLFVDSTGKSFRHRLKPGDFEWVDGGVVTRAFTRTVAIRWYASLRSSSRARN